MLECERFVTCPERANARGRCDGGTDAPAARDPTAERAASAKKAAATRKRNAQQHA
mgnify:CR=1 FL=1